MSKELIQLMNLEIQSHENNPHIPQLISKSGSIIFDKLQKFDYTHKIKVKTWRYIFVIDTDEITVRKRFNDDGEKYIAAKYDNYYALKRITTDFEYVNAYIDNSSKIYSAVRKAILKQESIKKYQVDKLKNINPDIYILDTKELLDI